MPTIETNNPHLAKPAIDLALIRRGAASLPEAADWTQLLPVSGQEHRRDARVAGKYWPHLSRYGLLDRRWQFARHAVE